MTDISDWMRKRTASQPGNATKDWLAGMSDKNAKQVGALLFHDERKPDDVAESLRIGQDLGLPPVVVSSDPAPFRRQLEQKKASDLLKSAPQTANWLRDVQNGALAKDDLENLTWWERLFAEPVKDLSETQFGRGLRAGAIGLQQMGPAIASIPVSGAAKTGMTRLDLYDRASDLDGPQDRLAVASALGIDPASPEASLILDFLQGDEVRRQEHVDRALRMVRSSQATMEGLQEAVQRYAADLQEVQGRVPDFTSIEDVQGFSDWFAYNTGQALPFLAATLVAGALGGLPGAAAAGYGMGVGDIQSELLERGVTDQGGVALAAAVPYAGLELLGPAAAPLRGVRGQVLKEVAEGYFRRLGREIPQQAVEEFINEAGQEIIKDYATAAATGEDVVISDEQLLRWFNAGMAGAASGGAMAPVSAGMRRSAERDTSRAEKATALSNTLAEIDDMVAQSKLRERSPDKFQEALGAQGLGNEFLYIEAEAINAFVAGSGIGPEQLDITPDELAESLASGGRVAVPISTYVGKIAGTDAAQAFADHVTSDPDGLTPSEAKQVDDMIADALEAAEKWRTPKATREASEITTARATQQTQPLFSEVPPGMSQADFTTYQRLAQKSASAAESRLIDRMRRKVKRETETWFREAKKATRGEVEAELSEQPVYRLMDTVANADGERINRKELSDIFGEGVIADLGRTRLGGKRAIYANEGLAPEDAAHLYGFANAQQMVDALRTSPRFRDAVSAETDRRLSEKFGDPMSDEAIEAAAMDAIHEEQQADTAIAEIRHLAKLLGQPTRHLTANIYRSRARVMIARMRVKDAMSPKAFLAAERKAAREAQKAFAAVARGNAGKLSQALAAKERQVLNGFLYNEAVKVEREIGSLREKMRTYGKPSIRKKLDGGYIEQIDAILTDYDFRKRTPGQVARAESLADFVERMKSEGREGELAIDPRVIAAANRKHYTRLTVDELRGVADTIANIDHLGRFKKKLLERKRKRELDASVGRVVQAITSNLGTGKSGRSTARDALNLVFTADTMLVAIDGFDEMGAAYDEIKAGIDAGQAEEQAMQVELAEKLDGLFSAYTKTELAQMSKPKSVPGSNGRLWSKSEILAVALNMGNEGNLERLHDPRAHEKNRLTPEQSQALVDTLDRRDWEFVQSMWDLIDGYWPQISDVTERRTGVRPRKVEAKPVATKHGLFRGGYYPVNYDPELPSGGALTAPDKGSAWDSYLASGWGVRPTLRAGMTQDRVGGGGRTLRLDLTVPFFHLKDTVRLIALSEAVDASGRILNDPRTKAAFTDAGRIGDLDAFNLWLADIASGSVRHNDPLNRFARMVKNNFTLSRLAFNMKTTALQLTGVAQSAAVIGKRNMLKGFLEYRKRPRALAEEVIAKSSFMAERKTTFQKDIVDFSNDVAISTPLASRWLKGKNAIAKAGFAPIVVTQFWAVDMPTWLGAYGAELERSKNEAKAVAYADRMVARAQDSGLLGDRNALSRGTVAKGVQQVDFIRLWSTLAGYMMAKANRGYITTARGVRDVKQAETPLEAMTAAANAAADLMLLYVAEGVMMGLLASMAYDDEPEAEDFARFVAREAALSVVGGFPVVRDAATGFQGYGTGGVLGTVLEMPANFWRQSVQGENDAPLRRSIADAVGLATGLPTTATMRVIEQAISDDGSVAEGLLGRNPVSRQ